MQVSFEIECNLSLQERVQTTCFLFKPGSHKEIPREKIEVNLEHCEVETVRMIL